MLKICISLFVLALCMVIVLLYNIQNSMIYLPVVGSISKNPEQNLIGYQNPRQQKMDFEDIYLKSSDSVSLHGWFIKQKQNSDQCATVVFFHENAGNLGEKLEYLRHYYFKSNVNILIVAYRGYSKSEGTPSFTGIQQDSIAILEYAFQNLKINKQKVFVHGRSLGGGTCVYALTHSKYGKSVAGVILENTFTSINDILEDNIGKYIAFLLSLLNQNNWDTKQLSKNDELINVEQMDVLQKKATKSIKTKEYIIPEGGHNDNWKININQYFQQINQFIQENY